MNAGSEEDVFCENHLLLFLYIVNQTDRLFSRRMLRVCTVWWVSVTFNAATMEREVRERMFSPGVFISVICIKNKKLSFYAT